MRKIYILILSLGMLTALNAQDPIYNFTFTGGFQDWTSQSLECGGAASDSAQWMWLEDGVIDDGAYSKYGLMNSRTPDSGIVILNSDFLDNNGLDDNIGGGDCPAPQIAELISPTLDFSGEDSVYLSFNQLYYRFVGYYNDQGDQSDKTATYVLVSGDAGATFDTIAINEDLRTFRATQNYLGELTLDISGNAAGKSEVIVKFLWKGDYYLWALDDVRLYGGRKDDLEISAFKYPVSNFETPEAQIQNDTLRFVADVVNIGNLPVDSAYLYITIRGNDENDQSEHFQDSVLIEDMAPNDTMEVSLPNYFTGENLVQGSYAFVYRLRNTRRPTEINLANNIRAEAFIVSETKFRKTDRGDGFGFGLPDGSIIGNYYSIHENFQERILLDKINFSTFATGTNSLAGKEMVVYLLKIDNDVADDLSDWNFTDATENKKSVAAIGSYTFTADDDAASAVDHRFSASEFINLDAPDEPIVLEPGGRYIAAVEYTGSSADLINNLGERITYYSSLGSDQFNTMIYHAGDMRWYTGGFGDGLVAVIGLEVKIEMTPNEDLLSPEEVSIFPNPTSDFIRVRMSLDKPQGVNVYLTDVTGKLLNMTNRSNFIHGTIELDVQSVPAGTYFLNVSSAAGMRTQKISVVH